MPGIANNKALTGTAAQTSGRKPRNPNAFVRLRGNGFDFSLYLGSGHAKQDAGGATFEEGKRPQADAVTLFTGNVLDRVSIPVLLDGFPDVVIQPRVDQIVALCYGDGRNPPPAFKMTGPVPLSGGKFNMEFPEFLDEPKPVAHEKTGALIRQALVLKLVEFNDPTTIKYKRTKSKRQGGGASSPSSIVLDQPMTLQQIAAKYLGDASQAADLGKLNGIGDVRKKLDTGTRVKLGSQGISGAVELG